MGRSCFIKLLIVSMIMIFTFSHGYGRKVMMGMETVKFRELDDHQSEEYGGKSNREMIELMDYKLDPEPNTNPRTGYIFTPPPQP